MWDMRYEIARWWEGREQGNVWEIVRLRAGARGWGACVWEDGHTLVYILKESMISGAR